MTTIRQILANKPDIYSVPPATTVFEALTLMAEKNVGALLVTEGGQLKGIFSERDYARKVILMGKSSRETRVSEIMTSRVICVGPEQTAEACMALMTDKRVRHLPVLESERLVGVISIGDVVRAIVSEQQFTIRQLESYITSGG
jgi:CBS domain-containing protein